MSIINIVHAIEILKKKEVIAYPTEGVFGIGCDPDSKIAVSRLLEIKRRSIKKGFILIAADYIQLKPYIEDIKLTNAQFDMIFNAWPGPITFVFPAKKFTPYWLTGCFHSVAARITNHSLVIELCRTFGKPLISTSANISGQLPCRTAQEVHLQFGIHFPVIAGETSGQKNPSEIRSAITYKLFRCG